MYIKQWLQEPIPKRQALMIIDETIWELKQQGKIPLCIDTQKIYEDFLKYEFCKEAEDYVHRLMTTRTVMSKEIQNTVVFVMGLWLELQTTVKPNE